MQASLLNYFRRSDYMADRKLSMIRNTGLSYIGQAYALLVGILILPFYLGHLGAEAYGLIGFFAVLQAWLQYRIRKPEGQRYSLQLLVHHL